jgi:regulator of protease activity HflC (stomatin/prohibitin superfamily)
MDLIGVLFNWAVIIVLIALLLSSAIKILPEYERGVLFRLGRLVAVKGPGEQLDD